MNRESFSRILVINMIRKDIPEMGNPNLKDNSSLQDKQFCVETWFRSYTKPNRIKKSLR